MIAASFITYLLVVSLLQEERDVLLLPVYCCYTFSLRKMLEEEAHFIGYDNYLGGRCAKQLAFQFGCRANCMICTGSMLKFRVRRLLRVMPVGQVSPGQRVFLFVVLVFQHAIGITDKLTFFLFGIDYHV